MVMVVLMQQAPVASQLLSVRADWCKTRQNGRNERYQELGNFSERQYWHHLLRHKPMLPPSASVEPSPGLSESAHPGRLRACILTFPLLSRSNTSVGDMYMP